MAQPRAAAGASRLTIPLRGAPPAFEAYAACAPGLEPWLARELHGLALRAREVDGGVSFTATMDDLYRANLHSRLASRVIVRVAEFRARALGELARRAAAVPWEEWLPPGDAVRLRVTARKSRLYHTGAIAERVMEGMGSRVQVRAGAPASDPTSEEDQDGGEESLLIVRVLHDQCAISLDSSGALLHRRGYRQAVAKAPLRETLAAAMLVAGEWRPGDGLADPLCGSGTIAIEAAMLARDMPPGLSRRFAFERWPRLDASRWNAIREEARSRVRPSAPARILASDRDAGAVAAARENALRANVAGDIDITHAALSSAPPGPPGAWIVTNPPYGVRVGEAAPLRDLYATLGRLVRERACPLVLLSANPELERQLGLPLDTVLATNNGGIPVRVRRAAGPAEPNDRGR